MQLQNLGEGNDGHETGFQWMLIGTPYGEVVYYEYFYHGHLDCTEMSTDSPNVTEEQLLEISAEVGNLWSEAATKIKRPNHFAREFRW